MFILHPAGDHAVSEYCMVPNDAADRLSANLHGTNILCHVQHDGQNPVMHDDLYPLHGSVAHRTKEGVYNVFCTLHDGSQTFLQKFSPLLER